MDTWATMLADRPLLETPLRDWTYEALDQFLDAHIREDERIEYKEKFSDATFTDTLVSMANGEGGYIFVGVSEQHSLPLDWPLLEPGKNHALTAYNKAGSETNPPVRIEAKPLASAPGQQEILVVRIEPGDNPPYFAKNRGVKVRVGESDVL